MVVLSWQLFTFPFPQFTYGQLLQRNNASAIQVTNYPKEAATRAAWKKDADEAAAKLKQPGLSDAEREKLTATQKTATTQAKPPAAPGATIPNYLTVPKGVGMWNFLALTFCLMVGTAGLPHILTRYYTTPSVKEARTSVAWGLFFIFLLYFTAPAYAAFARFVVYTRLVGTQIADLPRWVTLWKPAGLFDVVDKLGDGVVQLADFVINAPISWCWRCRDSRPALRDHRAGDGRRPRRGALHRRRAAPDHRQRHLPRPLLHRSDPKAPLIRRLTITKILLIATALIAATSPPSGWRSSSSWWPGPSVSPRRASSRRW